LVKASAGPEIAATVDAVITVVDCEAVAAGRLPALRGRRSTASDPNLDMTPLQELFEDQLVLIW